MRRYKLVKHKGVYPSLAIESLYNAKVVSRDKEKEYLPVSFHLAG